MVRKTTKTEIKNAPNNELIMGLVDNYTKAVLKNGVRCNTENKNINDIANELLDRGLLTEDDIKYLND